MDPDAAPPLVARQITNTPPVRHRSPRAMILGPLAIGVLAIAGWSFGDRLFGLASSPAAPVATPALHPPGSEASAWRALDRNDPLALQHFLATFPNGSFRKAAEGALTLLQSEAWAKIEQSQDVATKLQGLDSFTIRFASGPNTPPGLIEDIARARNDASSLSQAVEQALAMQGFDPGNVDGVISPQTIAAIQRYQKAMSLAVEGKVTPALLSQLEATTNQAAELQQPANGAAPQPIGAISPTAQPNRSAERDPIPSLGPEPAFKDCFVCPQMTLLPLGQGMIGDIGGFGEPDERPVRTIEFKLAVAIGAFEVTNDEWEACENEGGCARLPRAQVAALGTAPVSGVSWRDAKQFAAWLSRKTNKRYRLPSEAEWEYAARAGSVSAYASGDTPENLCAYANHADADAPYQWRNQACRDGFPKSAAPVGSFQPNGFGLYDLAGNVWEWVEDCWHPTYAGAPADASAWTSACVGQDRVLRGGSWAVRAANTRLSYRYAFSPEQRMPFFGFRVVREMN